MVHMKFVQRPLATMMSIGSIWRHKFAVWIIGFIRKPNYLGHMTTLWPIILREIKAPPIMRCPCFRTFTLFFRYLWKIFLPRGLKYSLFYVLVHNITGTCFRLFSNIWNCTPSLWYWSETLSHQPSSEPRWAEFSQRGCICCQICV